MDYVYIQARVNNLLLIQVIRVQTSQPIQVSVTVMFHCSVTFSTSISSMCASPPGHLDIIINYKKVLIDVLNDIIASSYYGEEVDTNCCGGRR